MPELDPKLSAEIDILREAFAEKIVERRASMAAAIDAYKAAPDDTARRSALSILEQIAHQISGSGALFGFAELGGAAEALESACKAAVVDSDAPDVRVRVITNWRAVETAIDAAGLS